MAYRIEDVQDEVKKLQTCQTKAAALMTEMKQHEKFCEIELPAFYVREFFVFSHMEKDGQSYRIHGGCGLGLKPMNSAPLEKAGRCLTV